MENLRSQGFQKGVYVSSNSKIERVMAFSKSAFLPYKISLNEILYGKNALFHIALALSIFELGEI